MNAATTPERKAIAILNFTQPTTLKRATAQASLLPDSEKFPVTPDEAPIELLAFKAEAGHYWVTLKDKTFADKNSWYVWHEHCRIDEIEERNPEDEGPISFLQKPSDLGPKLLIPGISNGVYANAPIHDKSPNFFWYEALHFNRQTGTFRRPASITVTENIIKHALLLQELRDKLGHSFRITSWYRDPATNARVGGARASRHLLGDATDKYIGNYTKDQMFRLGLAQWRHGGVGTYRRNNILHLDSRHGRDGGQVSWRS